MRTTETEYADFRPESPDYAGEYIVHHKGRRTIVSQIVIEQLVEEDRGPSIWEKALSCLSVRTVEESKIDWQKGLAFNGTFLVLMAIYMLFRLDPKVKDWEDNGIVVAVAFASGIISLFLAIVWYHVLDLVRLIKGQPKSQESTPCQLSKKSPEQQPETVSAKASTQAEA